MILVFVLAGGALTAAGMLNFIGIKFCKDRFQAVLAVIAGLSLAIGGEAALSSSSVSFFKRQEVQTSVCELEGETAHPTERHGDSAKIIFTHIVGCMKAAGYAWTMVHKRCQEAPLASNPFCYLPSGTFARAVTWAQMQFE